MPANINHEWNLWVLKANGAKEIKSLAPSESSAQENKGCIIATLDFAETLSPAFIHGAAGATAAATAADLWQQHFSYANAAAAEQLQQQLHHPALLHPALQQQLPVRSFL